MYSKEEARRLAAENIGSLEFLCKEAVCTADLNLMLALGFPEKTSKVLAKIVTEEATSLGIHNLRIHFEDSIAENKSNLINLIVRNRHKVYFATRSKLHPIPLLEHLEAEPTDLCATLYRHAMKRGPVMKKARRALLVERAFREVMRLERDNNVNDLIEEKGFHGAVY